MEYKKDTAKLRKGNGARYKISLGVYKRARCTTTKERLRTILSIHVKDRGSNK